MLMSNVYYTAADFPLPVWIKGVIVLIFWAGATIGLLRDFKGNGSKFSHSIGVAIIGVLGITMPLWIEHAVAFAANRYQEWS